MTARMVDYVRRHWIAGLMVLNLVNGQPATMMWTGSSGWVDITGLLYSDRDNTLLFTAWNYDGAYAYDFAIKHEDDIKWAVSNTGSGQTGVVLHQDVIITGDGQIHQ